MWRARSLARLTGQVVVAAALIELLLSLPIILTFGAGLAPDKLAGEILSVIADGALEGLTLALPMALVTLLFFLDRRRLKRYGLAMTAVALCVSLIRWSWIWPLLQFTLENPETLAIAALGRRGLIIALCLIACRVAAGRYRRHALAQTANESGAA